jgi:hypothetical protein
MRQRYFLWNLPLIDGGEMIIIHEITRNNNKVTGFVNHRFTFPKDQ